MATTIYSSLPQSTSPRTALHIHPESIRRNLGNWRARLTQEVRGHPPPRLWAVVKSDAYGHGLAPLLPAFAQADGLAVSTVDELIACRSAGWHKPLLYMGCDARLEGLDDPALAPLHVMVCHASQIARLEAWNQPQGPSVWLRAAGRLNHAGFKGEAYRQAWQRLSSLLAHQRVAGLGHMLHYAAAETPELLAQERREFMQLIQALPGPVCSENSSSLLVAPEFARHSAWVRSGVALYGINPLEQALPDGLCLHPAMSLRAPIDAIQTLEAGEMIGYGGLFRAPVPMRVGLVRCGYAHGYPRHVGNGCPCLLAGRRAPIIGRVSMEALSIDLSAHPQAQIGDLVSLWGEYALRVETIADSARTNAASLCTGLTARLPRYYPGDPHHVGLQA